MSDVILPQVMDTRYAAPFLDLLRQQKDSFIFDATCTRSVGGLCFQLLLSAHRTAEKSGAPFEIRNATDQMKTALALLGGSFLIEGGPSV